MIQIFIYNYPVHSCSRPLIIPFRTDFWTSWGYEKRREKTFDVVIYSQYKILDKQASLLCLHLKTAKKSVLWCWAPKYLPHRHTSWAWGCANCAFQHLNPANIISKLLLSFVYKAQDLLIYYPNPHMFFISHHAVPSQPCNISKICSL